VYKRTADAAERRAEFVGMAQEVERLGVQGLEKRSKQEWERRKLQQVGARVASKGARLPMKIGLGMAHKHRLRAARAAEEERLAGPGDSSALGKLRSAASTLGATAQRKAMKNRKQQRGPKLSGENFKNGMLHVHPTLLKRK